VSSFTPLSPPSAPGPLYCLPAVAGQCPHSIRHIPPLLLLPSGILALPSCTSEPHSTQSASDLRDRQLSSPNPILHTLFAHLSGHASLSNTSEDSCLLPQAFSRQGTCAFQQMMASFLDDRGQPTPVLLSPFSDCKTPNPPAQPVRVLTPHHLRMHSSLAVLQVSKSCSCNVPRKRRCLPTGARSSRRPRRQDCPIGFSPHGPGVFDRLPWVSILDAPAPQLNPWGVMDLSQLPVDECSPLGPIRRRKTSLRSVPFPPTPSSSPTSHSSIPFPSLEYASRDPRTPPRETEPPSAIRFQGLLPAPV
jgi:hypothetical protein